MKPKARQLVLFGLLATTAITLWVWSIATRRQETRESAARGMEHLRERQVEARERGERRAGIVRPGAGAGAEAPVAARSTRVTITLDSEPRGAEIYDSRQTVVGITPFELEVPGSHEPRRFTLKLSGYGDETIELIPDENVGFKAVLKELDGRDRVADGSPAVEGRARGGGAAISGGPAPGVDPDCYGDGYTCDRTRVQDAEQLVAALESTINAAGWPVECVTVQYFSGDAGESDAISVAVSGPRRAGSTRCHEEPARGVARSELARLAKSIRRVLGKHAALIRDTDLLQVTDGMDTEVQLRLH